MIYVGEGEGQVGVGDWVYFDVLPSFAVEFAGRKWVPDAKKAYEVVAYDELAGGVTIDVGGPAFGIAGLTEVEVCVGDVWWFDWATMGGWR